MRMGAVCSAGGNSFFSAVDLLTEAKILSSKDVMVITDRECGAEEKAKDREIQYRRIEFFSNADFSEKAKRQFAEFECNVILLFYSRLVTEELFDHILTLNIHPSLLPAFRGFGALKKAKDSGAKFIGATLHIASSEADAGEIVAQVASPISNNIDYSALQRISYVQKTYLTLCAVDHLASQAWMLQNNKIRLSFNREPRITYSANPALLSHKLVEAFDDFQKKLGLNILSP